MSKRANPTRIGLFLLGGLAIAIAATVVLASPTWFTERTTFVSYFPESVNGLASGAPVKFQGVPVGRITDINIQIDPRDNTFQVPVEFEIELKRLTTGRGTFVDLSNPQVLGQQIKKGLRAQLQSESLVTGVLYLELSYRTDTTPPRLQADTTFFPEIPTTPSLMSALGGGAGSILTKVTGVLTKANDLLGAIDVKTMNDEIVKTAKAVEQLVSSPELRATLRQMPGATAQLQRTLAEAQRLATRATVAIDTVGVGVSGASIEAQATLQALRKTIDETHGLLSADTGPGYELTGALKGLREAANALTTLINSLEQNPDMLLRGKRPPEKK